MLKYKELRFPGFFLDRITRYSYLKIGGRRIPIVTDYSIELNPRWKSSIIVLAALAGLALSNMWTPKND